ncbi:MAG: RHS repeat-associated core domain-containing protein [Chloroflexota bacterium]
MYDNDFQVLCVGLGCLQAECEVQANTSSDLHWAGEYEDNNDLIYLRARYYNPDTGTFLSLDPVEGSMNDPISVNGYAYAHDNPVNRTDPSGLCPDWLTGSAYFAEVFNNGLCFASEMMALQGCDPLTFIFNGFRCPSPPTPTLQSPFPTNTPYPTATPGIPTCDPSLLPQPSQIIQQTFRSATGHTLDPNNYVWRSQPYHIHLTQYGAATLPISDISQITRDQAYAACCGNGVFAVGEQIYKCTRTPACIGNTPPPDFAVTPDLFQLQDDPTCRPDVKLPNQTCAIPGRTGAVSTNQAFIGSENIGSAFVYFIPDNGSAPFPLYVNDGGGGTAFQQDQIDVYVGRLQPNSIVPVQGQSYSGMTGTACVLARPDVNIPTPLP